MAASMVKFLPCLAGGAAVIRLPAGARRPADFVDLGQLLRVTRWLLRPVGVEPCWRDRGLA